jgi:hypothetical protein
MRHMVEISFELVLGDRTLETVEDNTAIMKYIFQYEFVYALMDMLF